MTITRSRTRYSVKNIVASKGQSRRPPSIRGQAAAQEQMRILQDVANSFMGTRIVDPYENNIRDSNDYNGVYSCFRRHSCSIVYI